MSQYWLAKLIKKTKTHSCRLKRFYHVGYGKTKHLQIIRLTRQSKENEMSKPLNYFWRSRTITRRSVVNRIMCWFHNCQGSDIKKVIVVVHLTCTLLKAQARGWDKPRQITGLLSKTILIRKSIFCNDLKNFIQFTMSLKLIS